MGGGPEHLVGASRRAAETTVSERPVEMSGRRRRGTAARLISRAQQGPIVPDFRFDRRQSSSCSVVRAAETSVLRSAAHALAVSWRRGDGSSSAHSCATWSIAFLTSSMLPAVGLEGERRGRRKRRSQARRMRTGDALDVVRSTETPARPSASTLRGPARQEARQETEGPPLV